MSERGTTDSTTAGISTKPVLQVTGITKNFPGTKALDRVDFDIRPGEVHALVGHNGSGKSTLIKILAGYHDPDEGAISVFGAEPVSEIASAAVARDLGLRFVHQDLGLIESLSAVENLALGRGFETGAGGRIRWTKEIAAAKDHLGDLGYRFDVRTPVGELSAAQRAGIGIARALYDWEEAAVLVVDEPTAALPTAETEGLFRAIDRARAKGLGVLYVSHRLEEVFRLSDRVTVFRDGKRVGTYETRELDKDGLINLMLGGEHLAPQIAPTQESISAGLLEARSISGEVVDDVSFSAGGGEVLGIAGLTGSGRDEILGLLFGAGRRTGELIVDQEVVAPGDPRDAMRRGIGLVPADRRGSGGIEPLSVRLNMTLTDLWRNTNRFGALRTKMERAEVQKWIGELDIKPPRDEAEFSLLSGGNQQKVVMAKWLRLDPRVLLLDDPNQGVDVHSKAILLNLARDVAAKGSAVIIASSDDEELRDVCDRIIVMREGKIVGQLTQEAITLEAISRLEIDFQAKE